jgi:hypothetical protein
MKISFILLLVVLSVGTLSQVTPPVWPYHFTQEFVESYANSKFVTSGKMWFDSNKNMSRLDRTNGRYEGLCSSVKPGVTGACIQLVR